MSDTETQNSDAEGRSDSKTLLGAVADALDLLAEYTDPDWLNEPDNVRCDISLAREKLLAASQHYHNPDNVFAGDTCVVCGENIRHQIHKRISLFCDTGYDDADGADWWWHQPADEAPLATKRSRKCCSCNTKISVGDAARKVRRYRPTTEWEEMRGFGEEVGWPTGISVRHVATWRTRYQTSDFATPWAMKALKNR